MTVLTVVGSCRQSVAAAPVSRAIRERRDEVLVRVGRPGDPDPPRDSAGGLERPAPDYRLDVGPDDAGAPTAEVVRELEPVVREVDPDVLLAYGDTNSTLASAVVAGALGVTLARVGAGRRRPGPEGSDATNRVLADHAADLRFAPSEHCREALAAEGVTEGVYVTGDVTYDGVLAIRDRLPGPEAVSDASVRGGDYVLATVDGDRNAEAPGRLERILEGLAGSSLPVIATFGPRTRERLSTFALGARAAEAVSVVDAPGYIEFLGLLDGAAAVATDDGSVQRTACFLGTPCVTLDEETAWPETVDAGWNTLVGTDPVAIGAALSAPRAPGERAHLYGDGAAAARVADALLTVDSSDGPRLV